MDAQRKPNSLRGDPNSRTTEMERQPFSDLSNFNLIPIETLRKLCCSTTTSATSSARTYSSNVYCTVPKSPISVSGSDSESSKPYNDNSTDAKSETNVGSSSFTQLKNPNIIGISAPVRAPASASIDGERALHGQRVTTRSSYRKREATVLPCTTLVENKRGKGEVVAEPVICLPHGSNKKEKVTSKPFNCLNPENKKDESEGVAKLVSSLLSDGDKDRGKGIVENVSILPANKKDKGKAIAEYVSLLPAKNKKDRWKEIFETLSSPPPKNNNDRGNANLSISNSCEKKNKGEDIVEHVSHLSTEIKINKGKESFEPLSSPPCETKKDRGNTIANIGSTCEKTMAQEISDVSLKSPPARKTREKRKSDKIAFSCPPLPKTRNTRNKIDEAGDVESSGSLTDPNAKRTKKRQSRKQASTEYMLPRDFVEQQKAYFKEIDEFELPEEEASASE